MSILGLKERSQEQRLPQSRKSILDNGEPGPSEPEEDEPLTLDELKQEAIEAEENRLEELEEAEDEIAGGAEQLLIKVKLIKRRLKDFQIQKSCYTKLNNLVKEMLARAMERARQNQRSTIMERDW